MIHLVGWTLLHAGWQSGVIAAAVAMALSLTRRARASTRYAIALSGLALMVAAPIATTMARSVATRDGVISSPVRVEGIIPMARGGASVGDVSAVGITDRDTASPYTGAGAVASLPQLIDHRVERVLPWIVAVWLCGIALFSLRMLAGVAKVRTLGRRDVSAVDAHIRAMAARVAERLGIRAAVRVLQSTRVDVPMVVGWFRPVVLVPVSLLAGMAPVQLEMLLAHEMAHISRYDTIVNLVQTIVETLLFFHPAVWWISARVREERENRCDDLAIASIGGDRGAYGRMLLLLEESRGSAALAAAATDGSLLRRVRRMVTGSPTRVELGATWLSGVITMLIALSVVVPSGVTSAAVRTAEPAVAQPAGEMQPGPSTEQMVRPGVSADTLLQSAATKSEVQPSQRSNPMSRLTAIASAAMLTVATANVDAQKHPNFSGLWKVVEESTTSVRRNAPPDTLPPQMITIEQTQRELVLMTPSGAGDMKMGYRIDGWDNAMTMSTTGPQSMSVGGTNFRFALDSSEATVHVNVRWVSGAVLDFSTPLPSKATRNVGTMRLSLEASGLLRMQVDIPSIEGKPAKRAVTLLRRVA